MTTSPRAAVRRLALGRLISLTGTFAAGTALNFTIYERTGSAAWLAATMLLTWGLTGFLGPVAGALGDRFDRRRVMIVSETAAAGCWIALAFMARSPAPLLGLAFIASILESPFFPASSAAIPNVAGVEHLSWANSLIAIGRNTGLTVGPLLGGLGVATLGGRWVFLANAASYLVSVLLSWSVGLSFEDREGPAEAADEHRGMIAGFRFVMRDRVLRQMAIAWFIFLLGMASTLIADPPLAKAFGAGSIGYGMITTAWGGGTILGSFLARRMTEQSEGWWLVLASAVVALTGFGVALSPWFWMVLVWVALFGIADGPTLVAGQNLLQRRTPDVVRSRVMGAWEGVMHSGLVLAMLIGAVVVPAFGPRGAYALGGFTGLTGALLLAPLLRWLPDRRAVVALPDTVEGVAVAEPKR